MLPLMAAAIAGERLYLSRHFSFGKFAANGAGLLRAFQHHATQLDVSTMVSGK